MKHHFHLFRRLTALALGTAVLASSLTTSAWTASAEVAENDTDNFAKALQYSMYFYDANMCGTEVSENTRLSWRGDCHTYDSQVEMNSTATNLSEEFLTEYADILDPDRDSYIDVSGGFHDAGDHVKFGMPENYSAATLGWGYYEFRDAYVTTGQDDHIETILRYFNDYLMKCTFRDEDGTVIAHCYQVGDGDIDHAYWNSPELDEMERPAYFLTAEKPQTDYVVSAAASLIVNYLNFKDTDPEYAAQSLDYAIALFDFAESNEKELSDNADGPKTYYYSQKWEDDYVWAAAWLYKATEDITYLELAMPYVDYYAPSGWAYCWNDVWSGAITLLGEIDLEYPELDLQNMYRDAQGKTEYEDADFWLQIEKAIGVWMNNYTTPGGYAFLNTWGSARYNTAMQFVTLIYDKYKNDGQPSEYSDWAKGQMEYLLGDNPLDRCYVVGYNENSVKYPHHRAASGLSSAEDTGEQRHVLYGALVGGPDGEDNHNDSTNDYIYNEVTIDYNAAFVGACAGLYTFYGDDTMEITEDFPPAEEDNDSSGNDYWVSAYAVDDVQTSGAGVTKIAMLVYTNSLDGKTDLSIRYYFSVEEMLDTSNISLVTGNELYDQAAVEASPADGVISGPYQYDASYDPNIYYIEISFDGYKIANSNKKYQFTVGLYYGDNWDPSNDWSYQDITKCTDTYQDGSETRTDYICVYSDGVLVGGIEPNGSTPAVEDDTDTTTTVEETTTTTSTTTSETTTMESVISTEDTTETSSEVTTESTTESTETMTETTTTTTIATDSSDTETNTTESSTVQNASMYGDVNLDGSITLADLILLNKANASMVELNAEAILNADCNLDNGVDASDALLLMRFLVQLVDSLGIS